LLVGGKAAESAIKRIEAQLAKSMYRAATYSFRNVVLKWCPSIGHGAHPFYRATADTCIDESPLCRLIVKDVENF